MDSVGGQFSQQPSLIHHLDGVQGALLSTRLACFTTLLSLPWLLSVGAAQLIVSAVALSPESDRCGSGWARTGSASLFSDCWG